MDNNSNFLDSYKKKLAGDETPPETGIEAAEEHNPLRYEEKSGFVKPQVREPGTKATAPKRPKFLIPIIIAGVVVLAVIVWLIVSFTGGTEVIDFTNWTLNDAQLWARDHKVILQVKEEYNDQVDEGKIISQNIAKGTKVEANSFIQLSVSLGHDLTVSLPLPDLMSMTKDEVEAWAAKNFMAKVRITAEFSEKVPTGNVISFQINDTTVVDKVTRNTPIYVIVSKGKEDDSAVQVTVPNFKEKTLAECYAFANENGIVLTVKDQYDDYAPKGSIISQSVKKDEKISKGDAVILVVSKGKMITVPSFSGLSKERAAATATSLGITAAVVEKYSSASVGAFISQSIEAGTVYEEGEILELRYSLGNKFVVPSFLGLTRDAIENWAKEYNDKGAKISIIPKYTQSSEKKGNIIYQDKVNTVVNGIKFSVTVAISSGKVVNVQDFKGMTRNEALAACETLGLVPIFESKVSPTPVPSNQVWAQSEPEGKELSEGDAITLWYNP